MNIRNARSAVIEALPNMLSSMGLIWGVVMREELHKRAPESVQNSRHASTSVYFKNTKVCVTYTQMSGLIQSFLPYIPQNFLLCYLGLTAADTGISPSSNETVRSSAHGFTGRSVEPKKEQKETQKQSKCIITAK